MRRREFIKKSAMGTTGAAVITASGSIVSSTGNDPRRNLTFVLDGPETGLASFIRNIHCHLLAEIV
jgi:hypothetical protein